MTRRSKPSRSMGRVQANLYPLSFVGGGVVNETPDQRRLAGATTETRSRSDGGSAGARASRRAADDSPGKAARMPVALHRGAVQATLLTVGSRARRKREFLGRLAATVGLARQRRAARVALTR
jgi:hypothetical protein